MKRFSIYEIIFAVSTLVRQFILPNPFDCFGNKAFVINLIAEPIIHAVSFALVGLVYRKGSNPALGSFLYLVTYAMIVLSLWILSIFKFAWWWILLCVIAFIGLIIGIRFLCNKLDNDYYD